jgi:hypothetical protein
VLLQVRRYWQQVPQVCYRTKTSLLQQLEQQAQVLLMQYCRLLRIILHQSQEDQSTEILPAFVQTFHP